jgi:hypothetical protein
MSHSFEQLTTRMLLTITALAASSLIVGCVTQVETGDGDEDPGAAGDEDPSESAGDSSAAVTDAACKEGESRSCVADRDAAGNPIYGFQQCARNEDDHLFWTNCTPSSSAVGTPLVLSFDRAPVQFAASAESFGFDLTGTMSVATDWPTARTPWLALDRDGNGRIDDGSELFGSATLLPRGGRAANGFIALRELDDNGDGQITALDAGFARLLLWSDRDGDRVSTNGELAPASSSKLISIELGYTTDAPRCDARGNCEIERATFQYMDEAGVPRRGDVIDVHLKFQ